MSEFIEQKSGTKKRILTAGLLCLDTGLDLLRMYGAGIVLAALCAGVIGGYAGLFGAMTISGAVLGRYLIRRNLPEVREDLPVFLPSVLLCGAIAVKLDISGGLFLLVWAGLCYGLSAVFSGKRWSGLLALMAGAAGMAGACLAAVLHVKGAMDLADGILLLFAGIRLFLPLLKMQSERIRAGVIGNALKALVYPSAALYGSYAGSFLKTAFDETGLFRLPVTFLFPIVSALLLALCVSFEEEETETAGFVPYLLGSIGVGCMVFLLDRMAGIAVLLQGLAVSGALVYLHHLRMGQGRKADALCLLVSGMADIAVLFICLSRYNGTTFNALAVLRVMCAVLMVSQVLELRCLPDYVEETPDDCV